MPDSTFAPAAPNPDVTADVDALTLPLVSEEMGRLASTLTQEFENVPEFASAEVTQERDRVIVHWYGEPTPSLLAAVATEPSVTTEFESTTYLPGDLRSAAQALVQSDPTVASASAR